MQDFGVDWDGPIPVDSDEVESVSIPCIDNPLPDIDFSNLCATIDPLSQDSNYGIGLYESVLNFVQS